MPHPAQAQQTRRRPALLVRTLQGLLPLLLLLLLLLAEEQV